MFRFFQTILALIFVVLTAGAGYLGYQYVDAQNYTPDNVATKFIELTKNETDTLTSSEKKTLSTIAETNFLSNLQLETSIKSLRNIGKNKTSQISTKQKTSEKYSVYTIKMTGGQSGDYEYKMFIETTGEWYTGGNRSKIYKFEFPEIAQDSNLVAPADEMIKKVGEDLRNLFDKSVEVIDKQVQDIQKNGDTTVKVAP
jgi:hypothetical protein